MLTFLTRTKTADFRFWTLIGSLNIGMSNVLEDPSSEDIALIKSIYMYVKNHTRVSLKW